MSSDYFDRFGYEPKLPEEFREIFMWLCQDVAHIQFAWNFYLGLFTSVDYVEVADLAIASFLVIEEAVRADLTMSICRISDPAQTGTKENLTFNTLAKKCTTVPNLSQLVADFVTACEPIRKLRHKQVGHNDLNTRINPLNNPLPGVGQEDINTILQLAENILKTVIQQYVSVDVSFETISRGDASDLLFWLKAGKQYHDDHDYRLGRKN